MAVVSAESERPVRAPLSRQAVLAAALDFVDRHGLESLSMHKLGAALGVRAMSLYNHVAGKDDLLNGIVERLWEEVPEPAPGADWRDGIRQLANSLREVVHRHPSAAPLLVSRPELRLRPLRVAHGLLDLMRSGGVPEPCAVALVRTVFPYGIGYALAELALPPPPPPGPNREIALIRQCTGLLPPEVPDELVRTALLVCGEGDMAAQFRIGVDLMIAGLEAYLGTFDENAARTCIDR